MRKFTTLVLSILTLSPLCAKTIIPQTAADLCGKWIALYYNGVTVNSTPTVFTQTDDYSFEVRGAFNHAAEQVTLKGVLNSALQQLVFEFGVVGSCQAGDVCLHKADLEWENNHFGVYIQEKAWSFTPTDRGFLAAFDAMVLLRDADGNYDYYLPDGLADYAFGSTEFVPVNATITYKNTRDNGKTWTDVSRDIRADIVTRDNKEYLQLSSTVDSDCGAVAEFLIGEDNSLSASDQVAMAFNNILFKLKSVEGSQRSNNLVGTISEDRSTATFKGSFSDGFWEGYCDDNSALSEYLGTDNPEYFGYNTEATVKIDQSAGTLWIAGAFNEWNFESYEIPADRILTLNDLVFDNEDDLGFKFSLSEPVGDTDAEKWSAFNSRCRETRSPLITTLEIGFMPGDDNSSVALPGKWNITFDFNTSKVRGVLQTENEDEDKPEDSIETLTAVPTDTPPVYFNLQGLPIGNPTPGQILIRKSATETAKIIF